MGETPGSWPFSKRCFWLVLACLVGAWQGPAFVRSLRPDGTAGRVEVFDFLQDWLSARNFFAGRPVYGSQEEALRRFLGSARDPADPRDRFFNEVNAHPPTSVLLVLPLARLDYPDAFLVWGLFSLALGAVSLGLVVRQLRLPWSAWTLLPLATLLLVANPFRQQVNEGQWSLVTLFLLTATWAAARSGRAGQAGVWLALATALRLIPGFVFVYFAWRRQWKTLIVGALMLALVTALTAAVLGPDSYRCYAQETLPRLDVHHTSWANASLTGFWSKLFGAPTDLFRREPLWLNPPLARAGALLSSVLVTAALLWSLRRLDLASPPDHPACPDPRPASADDLGFGLTVIAMLLVSPVTWEHYFLELLVPLAVLGRRLPPSGASRNLFRLILVLLWVQPRWLWDLAIPGGWLDGTAVPWQTLTVLSVQFYALTGLFILGVVRAQRLGSRPAWGWAGRT
jgi:hypothetical protein